MAAGGGRGKPDALDIGPATRALTVAIGDVTARRLWQTELAPDAAR